MSKSSRDHETSVTLRMKGRDVIKRQVEELLLLDWIENVLDTKIDGDSVGAIKDGRHLCLLVNRVKEGMIDTIWKTTNKEASKPIWIDNVSQFLSGAVKLGMDRSSLFQPIDLVEGKNHRAVVSSVSNFAALAHKIDNSIPKLVSKRSGEADIESPRLKKFKNQLKRDEIHPIGIKTDISKVKSKDEKEKKEVKVKLLESSSDGESDSSGVSEDEPLSINVADIDSSVEDEDMESDRDISGENESVSAVENTPINEKKSESMNEKASDQVNQADEIQVLKERIEEIETSNQKVYEVERRKIEHLEKELKDEKIAGVKVKEDYKKEVEAIRSSTKEMRSSELSKIAELEEKMNMMSNSLKLSEEERKNYEKKLTSIKEDQKKIRGEESERFKDLEKRIDSIDSSTTGVATPSNLRTDGDEYMDNGVIRDLEDSSDEDLSAPEPPSSGSSSESDYEDDLERYSGLGSGSEADDLEEEEVTMQDLERKALGREEGYGPRTRRRTHEENKKVTLNAIATVMIESLKEADDPRAEFDVKIKLADNSELPSLIKLRKEKLKISVKKKKSCFRIPWSNPMELYLHPKDNLSFKISFYHKKKNHDVVFVAPDHEQRRAIFCVILAYYQHFNRI